MGECGLVRTSGAQGIVDIDHLQDAGEDRNFAARQSIRIARTVRMFVMVPDDWQDESQRFQRTANILARDGMELHDIPLVGTKVCSLLQNVVRDSDLSKIMQVPASLKSENGVRVHSELA